MENRVVNRLVVVAGVVCLLSTSVLSAKPADTYRDGVVYPITSTQFSWAMYEGRTRTMTCSTTMRVVREYYDVPRSVFTQFLDANLKGGFYRANIQGRYKSQRLRE